MKNKLPYDLDTLLELTLTREDNLLHLKILLCRSLQLHRGCKEPLSQLSKTHKHINTLLTELEQHRNNHQQSIFRKYQSTDISPNIKPLLFGFISKVQRHVKYFSNKLHSIVNAAYETVTGEVSEYQLELRQFGLEKIGKEMKLGVFLKEFQGVMGNRYRRELNKFMGFYHAYGYLVDKRAEKPAVSAFKQEKYRLLTTLKSVEFSVKCFYYYLSTLNHVCTRSFQSAIKGIKNLDLEEGWSGVVSGIHQSIKEDGYCEVYISKIEKVQRELVARNVQIQKMLPRGREREQLTPHHQTQSRAGSKVQRDSFNSRRSVGEGAGNRNLRSSNIQNMGGEKSREKQREKEKQNEKQKEKEKPNERRSVLRQTLVEIVLGDKQIHSKYAEPHTSDVFLPSIKDKHLKNQANSMYRRIYALKQSS